MEGQQLQWDDAQDALQAVYTVRHFDGAAGVLDGLVVIFVTDYNRAALAGKNLLQGILTFAVGVVSHDDHDDRHEFIHQGQWAVFQLASQDAL